MSTSRPPFPIPRSPFCILHSAFCIALAALAANAATYYVATPANGGSDSTGDGSQGAPFASLSAAYAAVVASGEAGVIHVADGTYQPTAPVALSSAVEIVGNDADPSQVVFDGQHKYKHASVSDAGVFIHGVTFHRGSNNTTAGLTGYPTGDNFYCQGCSFEMNAGTVSNCVISAGKGGYTGCISVWGSAKVLNSLIKDGSNTDNGNAGRGGCVKMGGDAVVRGCTLSGGSVKGGGCGAYLVGNAILDDCVVSNNAATATGSGVRTAGNGVVSNCVIRANGSASKGGGVYMDGGRLVDSLVSGNTATFGGGVYLANTAARVVNCTIADNTATGINGANLYRDKASQTINTLVAGGVYSTAGTDTTSFFGDAPLFVDAANGNYRLRGASPCIDAGTAQSWGGSATDVSGATARVIDGDGDGTAGVDIGAYEYDPAAISEPGCCFYAATPAVASYPAAVTFTPAVEGAYGSVISVSWNFGDGATESSASLSATTHTYANAGAYAVTLTVETTGAGMLTDTSTIFLKSSTVYVAPGGSTANRPYASADKPAASLAEAMSMLGIPASGRAVVHVADGTYPLTAPLQLTDPIEIAGDDDAPSQVIIDGQQKYKLAAISSEGVFIHGVTFNRGQGDGTAMLTGYPSYFQGCSIEMSAGTISNCVVNSGKANYSGCLSLWGTAKVFDSTISDGYNSDGNAANAGRGGSLKMAGTSVVRGCVIRGGSAKRGGGATVEGNALLAGCVVSNNTARGNYGGGVNIQGSGVVSNCVIYANKESSNGYGGGAWLQAGKLVNSLVHGNTAKSGGGVYQTGGSLVNCTVVNNEITDSYNGVWQTGGAILNTAVSGKAANDATALYSSGGTVANSCALSLTTGTDGNVGADPRLTFRDVDGGDYTLLSSSPCIDAGSPTAAFTATDTDLSGATPRVLDGNNDGTSAIDIGCYEYDPASQPTAVSFNYSVTASSAFNPTVLSFVPAIEGAYGAVTSVEWDFGDGGAETPVSLATCPHAYANAGTYTVLLTVGTTDAGTLTASATITLKPFVTYVSKSGSATPPYDTPARATDDIEAALAALGEPVTGGVKVFIADGTYDAPASRIIVTNALEIIGDDADRSAVVIDGANTRAFFLLDNPGAFVHGISFYRGKQDGDYAGLRAASYSSAPLEARQGVISNCVIDACVAKYAGGVTVWNTGRLYDSLVSNCSNQDGNGSIAGKAGGLKVYQNAIVSGCTITNCVAVNGGGAALFGGMLDRCVFFASRTRGQGVNGQIGGAGIYIDSGSPVVRNCLVYGNEAVSGNGTGGGVYCAASGAVMESCTIADNSAAASAEGVYLKAGTLRNSIVLGTGEYDSANPPLVATGGTVAYCCSPSLTAGTDGNVADAPIFKNRPRGDYSVKFPSPTINAGVNADWMANALDLAGNCRIASKTVDMGCYEQVSAPTMLLLR